MKKNLLHEITAPIKLLNRNFQENLYLPTTQLIHIYPD